MGKLLLGVLGLSGGQLILAMLLAFLLAITIVVGAVYLLASRRSGSSDASPSGREQKREI